MAEGEITDDKHQYPNDSRSKKDKKQISSKELCTQFLSTTNKDSEIDNAEIKEDIPVLRDNTMNKEEEKNNVNEKPCSLDEQSSASIGAEKLNSEIGKLETAFTENEEDENDDDYADDIETGNPELFTPMDRNNLYEKGVTFLKGRKKKSALKCFHTCIKNLNETNGFTFLPQCLRKIADLYYEKGEYEKAIQFIQAEKMYYETALIDTSTIQKKLESFKLETDLGEGKISQDCMPEKPEVVRADEYENLARMCLEKKQAQLALEYQAKATKIRQQIFGEDHPITIKSLDFFTVVYAEVGKQQYSESMQKLGNEKTEGSSQQYAKKPEMTQSKSTDKRKSNLEQVEEQIRKREQDEFITRLVLWVLFFIWVLVLSLILFYIYCKIDVNSRSCAAWRADIHYYYMRFKYFFYMSLASPKNTYG